MTTKPPIIQSIITVGDETCSRLVIENDGTGSKEFGNYDVLFYQPHGLVCEFRVENWHRGIGLEALVMYALNAFVFASERHHRADKDFVFGGEAPKTLTLIENVNLARVVKANKPSPAPAANAVSRGGVF